MKKSDTRLLAPHGNRLKAPPQGAGKGHHHAGERPSAGPASRPTTSVPTSRSTAASVGTHRPSSASQIYRTPEPSRGSGSSHHHPVGPPNNNSGWHRRPGSTAVGRPGAVRAHRSTGKHHSETGTSLASRHQQLSVENERSPTSNSHRTVYEGNVKRPPTERLQPVDRSALRPSSASSLRPSSASSLRPSSASSTRPRLRPASALSSSQASKQGSMKRFRLTDCKPIDQNLLVLMGGRIGPSGATSDNVSSLSIHKSRLWIGNLQPLPANPHGDIQGLLPAGPARQQLFVRLRPNAPDSVPAGTGDAIQMQRFEEAISFERKTAFQSQRTLNIVKDELGQLLQQISSISSTFCEVSSGLKGGLWQLNQDQSSLQDTIIEQAEVLHEDEKATVDPETEEEEGAGMAARLPPLREQENEELREKNKDLEAQLRSLQAREASLLGQTSELQQKLEELEEERKHSIRSASAAQNLMELQDQLLEGREEVFKLLTKLSEMGQSQLNGGKLGELEELETCRIELQNAKADHQLVIDGAASKARDLIAQISAIVQESQQMTVQIEAERVEEINIRVELETAQHQLEILMDQFREIRGLLKRILDDDDMHDGELDAMAKKAVETRFGQRRVSQVALLPPPTSTGSEEAGGANATPNPAEQLYREAKELALCMHESMAKLFKGNATAQKELEHHRKGLASEGLLAKLNESKILLQQAQEDAEKKVKAAEEGIQHQVNLAVIKAYGKFEAEKSQLLEELAVVYNNHGSALKKGGDSGKAMEMFKKALHARSKASGEDSLDLAPIMINLAAVKLQSQSPHEAEPLFAKAYDLRLKELGEDDKHTIAAKKWLDKCLKALKAAENGVPHTPQNFDSLTSSLGSMVLPRDSSSNGDMPSARSDAFASLGSLADQVVEHQKQI